MSEADSTDRSGNGSTPEGDAPRLQDTVERESIRLPLPENPGDPTPAPEAQPSPEAPSDPESAWAPPDPETTAGPAAFDSTGAPAEADSGPPTEVLVGAAFAGGLVLALLLRRLGS